MHENSPEQSPNESSASGPSSKPQPLSEKQRRILGVLIEKARTTPDAYPLSLNGLVTGCNQKSNRSPVMNLSHEEVEDELMNMRSEGLVAEVHGGGRVPKYRHFAYDYLGVKGVEAGVMTELLLRGAQTVGDLRGRASRFEPIADVNSLRTILDELISRDLVVALTPAGRGQMVTHNLYEAGELEHIRATVATGVASAPAAPAKSVSASSDSQKLETAIEHLTQQLEEARRDIAELQQRVDRLEG